jgi:hypothetical protein
MQSLKRIGLFLSSVVFLGGLEIAASAGSSGAMQQFSLQRDFSHVVTTDEAFLEDSEEFDNEFRTDIISPPGTLRHPQPLVLVSYAAVDKASDGYCPVSFPKKSRAPPVL